MELDHLPIIDWEAALKLAGNKRDLAEDMLSLLLKSLPEDIATMKALYADQNYPGLVRQAHKLHGAVCYCGVPRLKTLLARLETQLKSNIMDDSSSLLDQLNIEVNLLLAHYPRHSS